MAAVNAVMTVAATSGLLSVNGACSKYSMSGSRGEPDASHSAVTMRVIDAIMVSRDCAV